MNEVSTYREQLPDTLEDLSKFVLVSEERIQALRAEIRAIKKVHLAKEVYEQKLAEAQEIGQITVEAAQKMGELLLQIQKDTSFHGNQHKEVNPHHTETPKTKGEITAEMGMTSQQVSQYQQMAQNPEAVQAAIAKAIENGDVVSRNQVMKEIRAIKAEIADKDRRIAELQNREPEVREVVKEVVKEVVPNDYEELRSDLRNAKKQADAWKQDYRREQDKRLDQGKKIVELEEQIKSLQEQTVKEKSNKDLNSSALMFAMECRNFLQKIGGYTFIAEQLKELNDREREGYVVSAKAMRDWAQILLDTIERNKDELYGSYND